MLVGVFQRDLTPVDRPAMHAYREDHPVGWRDLKRKEMGWGLKHQHPSLSASFLTMGIVQTAASALGPCLPARMDCAFKGGLKQNLPFEGFCPVRRQSSKGGWRSLWFSLVSHRVSPSRYSSSLRATFSSLLFQKGIFRIKLITMWILWIGFKNSDVFCLTWSSHCGCPRKHFEKIIGLFKKYTGLQ